MYFCVLLMSSLVGRACYASDLSCGDLSIKSWWACVLSVTSLLSLVGGTCVLPAT